MSGHRTGRSARVSNPLPDQHRADPASRDRLDLAAGMPRASLSPLAGLPRRAGGSLDLLWRDSRDLGLAGRGPGVEPRVEPAEEHDPPHAQDEAGCQGRRGPVAADEAEDPGRRHGREEDQPEVGGDQFVGGDRRENSTAIRTDKRFVPLPPRAALRLNHSPLRHPEFHRHLCAFGWRLAWRPSPRPAHTACSRAV